MAKFKGIGASSGVAIAKVFEVKEPHVEISDKKISDESAEIAKVKEAIDKAVVQIEKTKASAIKNIGEEMAAVFDAHMAVALDPMLMDEVKNAINGEKMNALKAVDITTKSFAAMFEGMDDAYMKERAADIKDVAKRIIHNLAGVTVTDLGDIDEEVIIVAHDLTPSETSRLDKKFAKGFITNIGGRTSHAAIMARTLGIPAVLGLKDITENVKNGDAIAIDGDSGVVLVNPSKEEIANMQEIAKKQAELKALNQKFLDKKTLTKDGHQVELSGNIGAPKDVEGVNANGGEGVGLFRSEFLYMDSKNWPTEEEQYESYSAALKGLNGKLCVVRTLDIGGDKRLDYFTFPEEMNPFLGYRAIRLCLDKKDIFKTQLRALIRSSVHGKLAIMFPMIATVDEFLAAKAVYDECKKELIKEGQKVSDDIQVGMMVEIPAAAVLAHQFSKHADFLSIGTNDLIQYSMAADRMSEKVAYLYQPLNPSILNLIKMTIDGGHANGKWVGMCGEMAGDPNAVPLLLGMGLDEFSMSASSILSTRRMISEMDFNKAEDLALEALECTHESEVLALVEKFRKG